MNQLQISQLWNQINNILELDFGRYSISLLTSREWYIQVLQILFPDLTQKLDKISDIQSEEAALDRILLLMTQQDIIEADFLEIKGADIISGNKNSICYMVQLFMALVQKALEEDGQEDQQQQQQERQQQQYQQEGEEAQQQGQEQQQQQYSHKIQDIDRRDIRDIHNDSKKAKERNYSEEKPERQIHSVLGIGNQFQPNQQDDLGSEQYRQHHQVKSKNNEETFKNVFPQNYPTNQYKPFKNTNFYDNNEEDEADTNYLKQKLQKQKSENQFKNLPNQKSPKSSKMHETQKVRKLVSHPQIPKNYPKATTKQEKKLTKDVKKSINNARKKNEKENIGVGIRKVTSAQNLEKKSKQLKYHLVNRKGRKIDEQFKQTKYQKLKTQNLLKLQKLLKWKQVNLQRQKQQLQKDMSLKVQLKKQLYIKKINKLILKLQKDRMIQKRKQQIQRQRKQKQLAQRKFQALEHQYRTQMKLIQEKSLDKIGKKCFANTDHKQIIQGLEKELKKQNEKQIISLKMKFRRQQAQLDDDLDKLQTEIVKAYKRN